MGKGLWISVTVSVTLLMLVPRNSCLADAGTIELLHGRVIANDTFPQFRGGELRAPQLCPYDTNWLSFEVRRKNEVRLYVYDQDSARLTEVRPVPPQSGVGRLGRKTFDSKGVHTLDLDWRPVPGPGRERWFVFSSDVSGFYDLWLGEALSGKMVRITHSKFSSLGPKWSPDGQLIAYVNDKSLWLIKHVINTLRDTSRVPTKDEKQRLKGLGASGYNYEIRWYPSGDDPAHQAGLFVYTHQDKPGPQSRKVDLRIYDLVKKKTAAVITDVSDAFYFRSASWDPSGSGLLAFYFTDENPEHGKDVVWGVGLAHVRFVNANDGKLLFHPRKRWSKWKLRIAVMPSYDLHFGPPWTSDGQYLLLARKKEGIKNRLFLYRSDDILTGAVTGQPFAPAYSFPQDVFIARGVGAGRNDRIAFVYQDGTSGKLLSAVLGGPGYHRASSPKDRKLVIDSRAKEYKHYYIDEPTFILKSWFWLKHPLFKPNFIINSRGSSSLMALTGVGYAIWYIFIRKPPRPERWFPPHFGP